MRILRVLPAMTVLILVLSSCSKNSFLDQTVTNNLNETVTFTDSTNSVSFLNQIYVDMGFAQDPRRFGSGGLDAASDEAEGPNASSTNGFIQFATASVNPTVVPDDAW